MMMIFQRQGGPGEWAGLQPLADKPFGLLIKNFFFSTYISIRGVSHAHMPVHDIV